MDRALVSSDWHLRFPYSSLRALPRPRSDHSPLVLTASSFIPAPQIFIFESFWLRLPGIYDVVNSTWNSNIDVGQTGGSFMTRITKVGNALRSWSAGFNSLFKKQSSTCLRWIDWLDRAEETRSLIRVECSLRILLKVRYGELCLREELKWKQRSRATWLRAGDANTRFFHLKACIRRSKNVIFHLSDGTLSFSNHHSIANYLFSFFRNLLGVDFASRGEMSLDLLYPSAPPSLDSLQDRFELTDIKSAIFSCGPDKAPGPDGLPLSFYQRFWSCLSTDIMEVFNCFYNGSLRLEDINFYWICLIPKKGEVVSARDIQPISLENGLIKIIAKVLAIRLQRCLSELINPFQSAFVRGRSIFDNFFSAHILTHHLHYSNHQAAILKIDFERAFDHINWNFLLDLLWARGFGPRWISWVVALLRSSSAAVLLNGVPGRRFPCKRGLRQGDPLSPLLFILCIDVLYRMLQAAADSGSLPTVGVGDVKIHTLQFADDLLIFFDGSPRSGRVIKLILDAFSASSGLKINYDKSSLVPINLAPSDASALANFFGCTYWDSLSPIWDCLFPRRR